MQIDFSLCDKLLAARCCVAAALDCGLRIGWRGSLWLLLVRIGDCGSLVGAEVFGCYGARQASKLGVWQAVDAAAGSVDGLTSGAGGVWGTRTIFYSSWQFDCCWEVSMRTKVVKYRLAVGEEPRGDRYE